MTVLLADLESKRRCFLNNFDCQACNKSSVCSEKLAPAFVWVPVLQAHNKTVGTLIGINIYESLLRTSSTQKVKEHRDFEKIVFQNRIHLHVD